MRVLRSTLTLSQVRPAVADFQSLGMESDSALRPFSGRRMATSVIISCS